MTGRITMADVARQAGVSLMTVSRVVNQKDDVGEATRQRILQIIDELGYRPSGIARGLATRRTGTLGLVVPDVANPFFAGVAHGVEQQAFATCVNLSLNGMGMLYDEPLEVGLELTLAVHQPEASLQGRAIVRHCTENEAGFYIGTEFLFDTQ